MSTKVNITRRTLLATLGASLCSPALAKARIPGVRSLNLCHKMTDERFSGDYFVDGLYEPEAMSQLDHLMRDFHVDESIQMDVRLFDLFADMQELVGKDEPLVITSGFRTKKTNDSLRRKNRWAARNSLHIPGMAADIKIHGVPAKKLVSVAKTLRRGGVGAYNGANFIHVDVGAVRSWRR